jgi:hypothetical protein
VAEFASEYHQVVDERQQIFALIYCGLSLYSQANLNVHIAQLLKEGFMVEWRFEVGDYQRWHESTDVLEPALGMGHHEVQVEGHAVDVVNLTEAH